MSWLYNTKHSDIKKMKRCIERYNILKVMFWETDHHRSVFDGAQQGCNKRRLQQWDYKMIRICRVVLLFGLEKNGDGCMGGICLMQTSSLCKTLKQVQIQYCWYYWMILKVIGCCCWVGRSWGIFVGRRRVFRLRGLLRYLAKHKEKKADCCYFY